ncbi:hypothetical protein AAHC03_026735 [Spirometra sp. Aus1]
MLQHAVSAPRSIALAVLDVAKAFDSVNHDTRLQLLPICLTLRSDACLVSAKETPSHPFSSPVHLVKLFPILIDSLGSSWME